MRWLLSLGIYLYCFLLQNWMSASPNEHLHLPAPNVFIPTDLSIKDFKDKVYIFSLHLFMLCAGALYFQWCCCVCKTGYAPHFVKDFILLEIMVQAWYDVCRAQGLCKNWFSLPICWELPWIWGSHGHLYKIINGLLEWMWYDVKNYICIYIFWGSSCFFLYSLFSRWDVNAAVCTSIDSWFHFCSVSSFSFSLWWCYYCPH